MIPLIFILQAYSYFTAELVSIHSALFMVHFAEVINLVFDSFSKDFHLKYVRTFMFLNRMYIGDRSSSSTRSDFTLQKALSMFREIFGCHSRTVGALLVSIQWVKVRDATKHHTIQRNMIPQQRLIWYKCQVLRMRNPDINQCFPTSSKFLIYLLKFYTFNILILHNGITREDCSRAEATQGL